MPDVPTFFVAGCVDGRDEERYQGLARFFGVDPQPLALRVYSLTFEQNGAIWKATVGRKLQGATLGSSPQQGAIEQPPDRADPASVIAIYRGASYVVITDGGGAGISSWPNPFTVSQAIEVVFFAQPISEEASL